MNPKCSYLVFARTPALRRVKTRLAVTLGNETTLRFYEAMLEDTVRNVLQRLESGNVHEALLFAYPPESASELALWLNERNLTHDNLHILPQEGATLGEQMLVAFRLAEKRGIVPALIIGTDSPTLPQRIFAEAEQSVAQHQAIIGRTDDGGFYLLGLPQVQDTFFFGADYSNDTVYKRTLEALSEHFTSVYELPVWIDIDDEASLQALVRLHVSETEHLSQTLTLARKYVGEKLS